MTKLALLKRTVDVPLAAADLAEAFCELDDDAQAQFFVEVAKLEATWTSPHGDQFIAVGRHLATCECATGDARDVVRRICQGMGGDHA